MNIDKATTFEEQLYFLWVNVLLASVKSGVAVEYAAIEADMAIKLAEERWGEES